MRARVAALALGALLTGGCASGDRGGAPAPAARVLLETRAGARHAVAVEVVRTDADRERGLMFRASLPADAGMLFVFDETAEHAFWMKNTLIPLDMIFLDDAGRVVGIVARAAPGSLAPRSGGPSRYVLEVNGGWAEARSVRAGDQARFEGVLAR